MKSKPRYKITFGGMTYITDSLQNALHYIGLVILSGILALPSKPYFWIGLIVLAFFIFK